MRGMSSPVNGCSCALHRQKLSLRSPRLSALADKPVTSSRSSSAKLLERFKKWLRERDFRRNLVYSTNGSASLRTIKLTEGCLIWTSHLTT